MTITAIVIAVLGSLFLIIGLQTPFNGIKLDTIVNDGPSSLFDLTRSQFNSKGASLLSLA